MSAQKAKINVPCAAFCGALSIAFLGLYASTYHPKYHTGFAASDPNAMMLPRAVLGGLVILTFIAFIQEMLKRRAAEKPAEPVRKATIILAIGFLACTAVMPFTGFVICVAPLVAGVVYALGERRWPYVLGTALIAGVGFWFLFHHLLLIRLPSIISGGLF